MSNTFVHICWAGSSNSAQTIGRSHGWLISGPAGTLAGAAPGISFPNSASSGKEAFECRCISPPEQLHSDQGKQFESTVMQEVCNILGMKKSRTTPYHPQCDGLVEHYNRTLLDMLATTSRDHPFDWEDQLPKVCMAYNTSIHTSTGYTPFYMMFGREARIRKYPPHSTQLQPKNHWKKPIGVSERSYQCHTLAGKTTMTRRFMAAHLLLGSWRGFTPLLYRGERQENCIIPWTGPYRVTAKLSDCDYRVKLLGSRRVQVVHFNRLKLCAPGTRFDDPSPCIQEESPSQSDTPAVSPHCFGRDMKLLDYDEPAPPPPVPPVPPPPVPPVPPAIVPPAPAQPYPHRHHHRPNWLGNLLIIEFETNSYGEEGNIVMHSANFEL